MLDGVGVECEGWRAVMVLLEEGISTTNHQATDINRAESFGAY